MNNSHNRLLAKPTATSKSPTESRLCKKSKDKLFISGLQLSALIGVYAEEHLAPQSLLLDITLTLDLQPAALSDEIADTVDYDLLSQKIRQWALEKPYQLIESLAAALAEKTLNVFPKVQTVRLKLRKFPALPMKSAGVMLESCRCNLNSPACLDHSVAKLRRTE